MARFKIASYNIKKGTLNFFKIISNNDEDEDKDPVSFKF